ncbi:MAG: hypothetical protein JWN72_1080, partial [Thermoleophilia bacterium]|nr:hypothetical protein [Thermoleophilia bacterium]
MGPLEGTNVKIDAALRQLSTVARTATVPVALGMGALATVLVVTRASALPKHPASDGVRHLAGTVDDPFAGTPGGTRTPDGHGGFITMPPGGTAHTDGRGGYI